MNKLYILVVVVIFAISSGFYVHSKFNELSELKETIQTLEVTRSNETLHFGREIERQQALDELNVKKGALINESEKDISDSGFTFSPSRLRRINQIE